MILRYLATVSLALAFALACQGQPNQIGIRVTVEDEELESELARSGWLGWIRSREGAPAIEIGPQARGDLLILAATRPLSSNLAELISGLPVGLLENGGIELGDVTYPGPGLSLALRLPGRDPATWVVTGDNSRSIVELVASILLDEAGLSRREESESYDLLLSEHRWMQRRSRWATGSEGIELDSSGARDDFANRALEYTALKTFRKGWIDLRAPTNESGEELWEDLAASLDQEVRRLAARIPLGLDHPVLVRIESDFVQQGRHLGVIGEAALGPDHAVHIVPENDDHDRHRQVLALALLRRSGLAPAAPWLEEGAALWLSGDWMARPWRQWLPLLAAAKVLPTAEELLAPERQADGSDLLWVPVAAAVIDSLPGSNLSEKLRRPVTSTHVNEVLARLDKLPRPSPAVRRNQDLPWLRGVSLAMVNDPEKSYQAPALEDRLERIRGLGANSISLMPFASQPSPSEPGLRFLRNSPASETDIGVLSAARRAHKEGLIVLWKPHIWVSHDSWPGEISMQDEASWAAWWKSYRRFVVHHAMLAQHADAEIFSLGVELGKTLERKEEWQLLIQSVRLVYGGALTYAGNWDRDFERFPFWNLLDLVGVDAYFSLATSPEASPEQVFEGARKVVARLQESAERFGRPLFLTEIGYPARKGAWFEPHREGAPFSAQDQATAYEAMLEALGQPPWLQGLFAWKVFSAERDRPSDRPDFRFLDRPAEKVVRDFFLGKPE